MIFATEWKEIRKKKKLTIYNPLQDSLSKEGKNKIKQEKDERDTSETLFKRNA